MYRSFVALRKGRIRRNGAPPCRAWQVGRSTCSVLDARYIVRAWEAHEVSQGGTYRQSPGSQPDAACSQCNRHGFRRRSTGQAVACAHVVSENVSCHCLAQPAVKRLLDRKRFNACQLFPEFPEYGRSASKLIPRLPAVDQPARQCAGVRADDETSSLVVGSLRSPRCGACTPCESRSKSSGSQECPFDSITTIVDFFLRLIGPDRAPRPDSACPDPSPLLDSARTGSHPAGCPAP